MNRNLYVNKLATLCMCTYVSWSEKIGDITSCIQAGAILRIFNL